MVTYTHSQITDVQRVMFRFWFAFTCIRYRFTCQLTVDPGSNISTIIGCHETLYIHGLQRIYWLWWYSFFCSITMRLMFGLLSNLLLRKVPIWALRILFYISFSRGYIGSSFTKGEETTQSHNSFHQQQKSNSPFGHWQPSGDSNMLMQTRSRETCEYGQKCCTQMLVYSMKPGLCPHCTALL